MKKILLVLVFALTAASAFAADIKLRVDKAELVFPDESRSIVQLSYKGQDVGVLNCDGNYRFLIPDATSQYAMKASSCESMATLLIESASEKTPVALAFTVYGNVKETDIIKGFIKAISLSEPE